MSSTTTKRVLIFVALFAFPVVTADARGPGERRDRMALRFSRTQPWHGAYAHQATGRPVALVVPPTAHMQSSWGWGVAHTEVHSIHHQFRRPFPGYIESSNPSVFHPTPRWPSHTDQLGVYYIRGPW